MAKKPGPKISDPELAPKVAMRLILGRERIGLCQDELATVIGVSRFTINRWERGLYGPTLQSIPPLCRALEMTPNQLLGWPE